MAKKSRNVVIKPVSRERKECMSCGCPCWRSDVSYCWDCYKYQYFESKQEGQLMRGRRGGYYGAGGGLIGLLAVMLLAIYAMPFVGGYVLITGKNDSSKLLGGSLLVVGIIIWIAMGIH